MKKTWLFCLSMCFAYFSMAQPAKDYAIPLSASVDTAAPSITIRWQIDPNADGYVLHRKEPGELSWTRFIGNFSATDSMYIDTDVETGHGYEYRIIKSFSGKTAYSYIYSGIEMAAIEQKGILILLIDSLANDSLQAEIKRLKRDLTGDGWEVKTLLAGRGESSAEVKADILTLYNEDPDNTRALFILGHVPVPYSGNIGPDGHQNHIGAWPADVYYAELTGNWTDNSVNTNSPSDPRNKNFPGDGKFDQSFIPGSVELQAGRVDFFDMPSFSASEMELLRSYLDKDHAYRQKLFTPVRRALVDDNFGGFNGEAFAANAWRNFPLMVGSDSIFALDYRTEMNSKSYLWSYGCGGGSYSSANGIGRTSDFATDSIQSIFTFLFGSYFGDWDKRDNFLRAAIAQGTTLVNAWAGRPNWHLQYMAMGHSIGHATRLTQNNSNVTYKSNYGARMIHITLMGDPTLKADIVSPPENLTAVYDSGMARLSWSPSSDRVQGYFVYRSSKADRGFQRIHEHMIEDTIFTDSCVMLAGSYHYMLRAVKRELGFAGSYFNLSQGIFDSLLSPADLSVTAAFGYSQNGDTIYFSYTGAHGEQFYWDFGDGHSSRARDPQHLYDSSGSYTVTLIAGTRCASDTFELRVNFISTGIDAGEGLAGLSVYPNPGRGVFQIIGLRNPGSARFEVYNSTGRLIQSGSPDASARLNLSDLPAGLYLLRIAAAGRNSEITIIKQ